MYININIYTYTNMNISLSLSLSFSISLALSLSLSLSLALSHSLALSFCLVAFLCHEVKLCLLWYGVATSSILLKVIGLFYKRGLKKRLYSAKDTYNFMEPTTRSHPMPYLVATGTKILCSKTPLWNILLWICVTHSRQSPTKRKKSRCGEISSLKNTSQKL